MSSDCRSCCTGLCKTAFHAVLPDAPLAHCMAPGNVTETNTQTFADFESQMMSFNSGENTKEETSLQVVANLVLCPTEELPCVLV